MSGFIEFLIVIDEELADIAASGSPRRNSTRTAELGVETSEAAEG